MAALLTVALARVRPGQGRQGRRASNVRYKKTTSINFEDDTIEGDLTKPDGEYVEARKKVKHSNLIRSAKSSKTR